MREEVWGGGMPVAGKGSQTSSLLTQAHVEWEMRKINVENITQYKEGWIERWMMRRYFTWYHIILAISSQCDRTIFISELNCHTGPSPGQLSEHRARASNEQQTPQKSRHVRCWIAQQTRWKKMRKKFPNLFFFFPVISMMLFFSPLIFAVLART